MLGKEWRSFHIQAKQFMSGTEKFIHQGINPGGYYKAVWCRDASYILKDWFLGGLVDDVMQELLYIWSHQITPDGEKIVFGRGSPVMKYLSQVAKSHTVQKFEGALPTSIFRGYSEVFGKNPDIDSTALMISTTSWIFEEYLQAGMVSRYSDFFPRESWKSIAPPSRLPALDSSDIIGFIIPRMLKAVDYLERRDSDDDGLLEQDHNEDWMDSVLRAGKIVYSQGCWILALTNLSLFLSRIKKTKQAARIRRLAEKNIAAVEKELWSDDEDCYIDKQDRHHLGKAYKTLTQDVSLYLIATTEKSVRDLLSTKPQRKGMTKRQRRRLSAGDRMLSTRAASTLQQIKNRIWKDKWPLVSETELKTSGPWILNPYVYHNYTFWPWSTGTEMLARSRYDELDECASLLSSVMRVDQKGNPLAFYEWISPVTGNGNGAFPFRTGISAMRIALADILLKKDTKHAHPKLDKRQTQASTA